MPKVESPIMESLKRRRTDRPFQPFVLLVRDGRRLKVNDWLQFGTQGDSVVVVDDSTGIQWTNVSDIAAVENQVQLSD